MDVVGEVFGSYIARATASSKISGERRVDVVAKYQTRMRYALNALNALRHKYIKIAGEKASLQGWQKQYLRTRTTAFILEEEFNVNLFDLPPGSGKTLVIVFEIILTLYNERNGNFNVDNRKKVLSSSRRTS